MRTSFTTSCCRLRKGDESSENYLDTHSILTGEERELSHSHPQFPRTTLRTPGTMTPHLATKYDDDDERLAILDSGFPTEA